MSAAMNVSGWMLDSSTFINALIAQKSWLTPIVRSPLYLPEYVLRVELGTGARAETRHEAQDLVSRGKALVAQLTLEDLERVAELCAPKRIGTGEICCAIIAGRTNRGVLCDDHKAHRWLCERIAVAAWESIEEILVAGGVLNHLSEYEVEDCQKLLESNKYICRYPLRLAVLGGRNSLK
jgi:hypothetical protein